MSYSFVDIIYELFVVTTINACKTLNSSFYRIRNLKRSKKNSKLINIDLYCFLILIQNTGSHLVLHVVFLEIVLL